jgi:outer membrane biosynthesis protein TonB
MVAARERRRWGACGLSSLGAHAMVVATCLIGRSGSGQGVTARYLGPGPIEAMPVELVSPDALEPEPEPAPASRLPTPSLTPRAVARGGRARTPRPMRAPPSIRMPSRGNPLIPPPFPADEGEIDDVPSTPDGPAPVTAGAGGQGASGASAGAIAQSEPYPVSPLQASYLRIYQSFPSVPTGLWFQQRLFSVELKICVATTGDVSGVSLLRSAAPSLDDLTVAAARTWRYKPLVIEGAARPFCHKIIIHYVAS